MKEDQIYMLRKIAVMVTCIVVFVTVGLVIVNFQSKSVTIDYYGEKLAIKTMSNTIEGMLMQNGIYIDEKAIVYPNVETRITNNMEIHIYREDEVAKLDIESYKNEIVTGNKEKLIEEIQYINFETVEKSNANKDRGTTTVIQKGTKGEKQVLYTVLYDASGKEIAKNVISETITSEPVDKIVEVGTKVTKVSRSNVKRISSKDLEVDEGFVKYNIKLSEDLQKYAYNMCKKYNIPYVIFLALMKVESGYRANAVSSTKDYGLCQINISNYSYLNKKLGTTNLLDPYQSIEAGAYWLSRYFKSWKKTTSGEQLILHALNSYNWGEGAYRKFLKKGNDAYSWFYGKKILKAAQKLEKNGGF